MPRSDARASRAEGTRPRAPRGTLTTAAATLALLALVVSRSLSAQGGTVASVKVQGVVSDSMANAPLSAARVEFVRADALGSPATKVTTDASGKFSVVLSPGSWIAQIAHDSYDSLGVELPLRRVEVPRSSTYSVRLATPSTRTLVGAHCPELPNASGVLVGMVRDVTSEAPLDSARVVAEFGVVTVNGSGVRTSRQRVTSLSNANGWYVGCDVPADGELAAWASRGDAATGLVALPGANRAIRRRDFAIDRGATRPVYVPPDSTMPAPDPARPLPRIGTHRLVAVVRDATGGPVKGARTRIIGHPVVLTDPDGRAVLDSLPAGTQTLEVRAIGFVPAVLTITPAEEGISSDTVRMLSVNALLDTIRVTGRMAYNAGTNQFERRRQTGVGTYLTADQIERRHAMDVSDLFVTVPGLIVTSEGFDKRVRVSRAGRSCLPTIYLDGSIQRDDAANDLEFLVRPSEITGIEIYKGFAGTPPEFIPPGGSTCGSIVIWTGMSSRIPRRPIEPDRP